MSSCLLYSSPIIVVYSSLLVSHSFLIIYGHDPQLPTEQALSKQTKQCYLDSDDYRAELVQNLSDAWEHAQKNVKAAQNRQKTQHDRKVGMPKFALGDRVFVLSSHVKLISLLGLITDPTGSSSCTMEEQM